MNTDPNINANSSSAAAKKAANTSSRPLMKGQPLTKSQVIEKDQDTVLRMLNEQMTIESKIKDGAENMLTLYQATAQKGQSIDRKGIEKQVLVSTEKLDQLKKQFQALKVHQLTKENEAKTNNLKKVNAMGSEQTDLIRQEPQAQYGSEDVDLDMSSLQGVAVHSTTSSPLHANRTLHIPTPPIAQHMFTAAQWNEMLAQIRQPGKSLARTLAFNHLFKCIQVDHHILHHHMNTLIPVLRSCGADENKDVRAFTFRMIRQWLNASSKKELILTKLLEHHINVIIVVCLLKDPNTFYNEREQACKLVRTIFDIYFPNSNLKAELKTSSTAFPQDIISCVIAMAEQYDDNLQTIALETLCELAVRDVALLASCDGVRTIFHNMLEAPAHLTAVLVNTALFIVDDERNRRFVRPAVDLEIAISAFTDAYCKGQGVQERLAIASKSTILLLRSWTGLLYFCMDDKKAIRSLVDSLRLPNEEIKLKILETLFQLFRVELPKWYFDFLSSRRPSVTSQMVNLAHQQRRSNLVYTDRIHLLDHYLAMMTLIFMDAGILEALIDTISHSDKTISTRSIILVGEILAIANRLLPAKLCARAQSLPNLFEWAASFKDETLRHVATSALKHIDNLHRHRTNHNEYRHENNADVNEMSNKKTHRQVEQVKLRMGIQMDDAHFRNLILETQIHVHKDYLKWNWDAILETLQGPLLNPKRLDEVLKGSKFIKRLLSFYRPTNHQFADIKTTKGSMLYARAGCALMKTLVLSYEGQKYLADNKLIPQIAIFLKQLDPIQGIPEAETFFSKERLAKTLTGQYLSFIGTLSRYKEGHALLDKFHIFNFYYRLSELRSRDDLIKYMTTSMDYSINGHPRIIISKIMTSAYKHIRHFATEHLLSLMRRSLPHFWDWGIRLLITQLYDPEIEISNKAVYVLDEACRDPQNLEALIALKPNLAHLRQAGQPLLLRFLSTSSGFQYLKDIDWIDAEMEHWCLEGNKKYVLMTERRLLKAVYSDVDTQRSQSAYLNNASNNYDSHHSNKSHYRDFGYLDNMDFMAATTLSPSSWSNHEECTSLPHFFGELTRTPEGCQLLRDKNKFTQLLQTFKQCLSCQSSDDILAMKAVLWAIGCIGSTPLGCPFLQEYNVINDIISLIETSPLLSLRGTCFYVLGLIAKTKLGVTSLLAAGWICKSNLPEMLTNSIISPIKSPKSKSSSQSNIPLTINTNTSTYDLNGSKKIDSNLFDGLAIPANTTNFLNISPWQRYKYYAVHFQWSSIFEKDMLIIKLLKEIGNLSNHILSSTASKVLNKIKQDTGSIFQNIKVYAAMWRMMAMYRYRMSSRRFMLDLFSDISLNDIFWSELNQAFKDLNSTKGDASNYWSVEKPQTANNPSTTRDDLILIGSFYNVKSQDNTTMAQDAHAQTNIDLEQFELPLTLEQHYNATSITPSMNRKQFKYNANRYSNVKVETQAPFNQFRQPTHLSPTSPLLPDIQNPQIRIHGFEQDPPIS